MNIRFDKESKTTAHDGRCGWFQLFQVFANPDVLVIEATNPDYIRICYDAFKHFVPDTHDIDIRQIDYNNTTAAVYDYSKPPHWEHKITKTNKKRWITSSWMYEDDLDSTDGGERTVRLKHRSLDPHLAPLIETMHNNPDYVDLGKSRRFHCSYSLIHKMQFVLDSKFYFGSTCSWSSWAKACGIKTYVFYNPALPSKYRKDFVEFDLQLI
jgi:hypothetical protein